MKIILYYNKFELNSLHFLGGKNIKIKEYIKTNTTNITWLSISATTMMVA